MQFAVDILPVIFFFLTFKLYGIYAATYVGIGAAVVQAGWTYYRHRRIELMQCISALSIIVLGSATIFFHQEMFIKWKPTVLNWIFALAFFAAPIFGEKTLVARMMEQNIQLPDPIWKALNRAWIGFFLLSGAINLLVAYNCSTETWVQFKLFGYLGMTLIFIIAQSIYISRFIPQEPPRE
jgi:intracellular septation protein